MNTLFISKQRLTWSSRFFIVASIIIWCVLGVCTLLPKADNELINNNGMSTEEIDNVWDAVPATINSWIGSTDWEELTYGDDIYPVLGHVRVFASEAERQTIVIAVMEAPRYMNVQRSYVHVNINGYQTLELPNKIPYQTWDNPKYFNGHWVMRAKTGKPDPTTGHFYIVFDQYGQMYATEPLGLWKD